MRTSLRTHQSCRNQSKLETGGIAKLPAMDSEERMNGLKYARSLNFTDAQYEEALKIIDTPINTNQLAVALLQVSSQGDVSYSAAAPNSTATLPKQTLITSYSTPSQLVGESSSSCYSSITSFPSSSDQSLEIRLNPQCESKRKIYIDGANVARSHAKDASFSWCGIKLCVDWFYSRHHQVKVFVPQDRCQQADNAILAHLRNLKALVETPMGCNDDNFIIEAARLNNGVIVSNDLFRDEKRYNDELQQFIHSNRLPYIFVDDDFIPARDPLGRSGPDLDEFLTAGRFEHRLQHRSKSLCQLKPQQRYQRRSCYANQQFSSHQRKPVDYVRSLPIGQHATIDTRGDGQSATYANEFHRRKLDREHQQMNGTASAVYSNSNSGESEIRPIIGSNRMAVYGKYYNVK